jgi:hypothetical protein
MIFPSWPAAASLGIFGNLSYCDRSLFLGCGGHHEDGTARGGSRAVVIEKIEAQTDSK